jgi:hypothetical protein
MQLHQESHANDDSLEKYSLGSLTDPDLTKLEEHLLVCAPCRSRLEATDEYVAAMSAAAARLEADEESRRNQWGRLSAFLTFRKLAWSMALAAALLMGAALRFSFSPWSEAQPFAVTLESSRGVEGRHVPAGRPLQLTLDISGLTVSSDYRVEIVDERGQRMSNSHFAADPGKVTGSVPKGLRRGAYFMRLYSPQNELLREYGLQVD